MEGKFRHAISFTLFLVFLFIPFMAAANVPVDGDSCNPEKPFSWVSEKEIRVCGTVQFREDPENDIATYNALSWDLMDGYQEFNAWNPDAVTYTSFSHYFFEPEIFDQNVITNYYIAIPKDNTSIGTIGEQTRGDSLNNIQLTNLDNGPEEVKFITKGKLWGKVYKQGEWESSFEDVIKKGKVYLQYYDPQKNGWTQMLSRSINEDAGLQSDESYIYHSLSISETYYGGKLPEGKYALGFYHSEQADLSGDIHGSPLEQLVSRASFLGQVTFNLKYIDSTSMIGYGAIEYIEQENEHEKDSATSTMINSPDDGIFLDVAAKVTNPLTSALEGVLTMFLEFLNTAIQQLMGIVSEAVSGGGDVVSNEALNNIMRGTRNTALSVLTLALLIIAFANILNIQAETYQLTRMIPKIITAIIMVFFSLIIAQFLLELATALTYGLVNAVEVESPNIGASISTTSDAITYFINNTLIQMNSPASTFGQMMFINVLLIFLLLAVLFLALLLLIRKVVLVFLMAVAPIAFILQIMPFTESLYKQWWSRFWKWAFMGPAIAFFLYMGNEFLINGYFYEKFDPKEGQTVGEFISGTVLGVDQWSFLILVAVCWGLAAYVPLKMGGEIFNAIGVNKIPGKLTDWAKRKSGVTGFLEGRKANIASRDKMRGEAFRNKLAMGQSGLGRFVAGTTEAERPAALDKFVSSIQDEQVLKNVYEGDLAKRIGNDEEYSKYEQMAALKELADRGRAGAKIDAKNAPAAHKLASEYDNLMQGLIKDNKEILSTFSLAGIGDADELAMKTATKASPKDYSASQILYLQKNAPGHIKNELSNPKIFDEFVRNANAETRAAVGQYMIESPEETASIKKALEASGMNAQEANAAISNIMQSTENFVQQQSKKDEKTGKPKVKQPLDLDGYNK